MNVEVPVKTPVKGTKVTTGTNVKPVAAAKKTTVKSAEKPPASAKKTTGKSVEKGDPVVYPEIKTELHGKHTDFGALTVDEAKKLIGWTEVTDKDEYAFRDLFGKYIQLANSPTNRPFQLDLAETYSIEHLRKKWAFNLESIVADRLGNIQQGQHRLVGFILAEQERSISPAQWGEEPLEFEVLLGFGVSDADEVADTYDTGKKRSLTDVLYRRQTYTEKISQNTKKQMAKVLAGAIRLVWLRNGGKQVSYAPRFPHSEATQFYKEHPGILDSVNVIFGLNKEKGISSLVSPAYAAALHYLMESADIGSVAKSKEFWELFSTGAGLSAGNPILTLRQTLTKQSANSGSDRDDVISLIIKAYLAWVNDETMTAKQLTLKKTKSGDKFINAEYPQLGGLDITPEVTAKVSKTQQWLLSLLKDGPKTLPQLVEATSITGAKLSKMLMANTKRGGENPESLEALGHVIAELPEGEPVTFTLKQAA